MHTRLAVVVVNYGSSPLLRENLVRTMDGLVDAFAVVVDNYTDAAERDVVAGLALEQGWTLVTPAENLGFGGGVNRGAIAAFADGATDLLVLNPDAHIDAASVTALESAARGAEAAILAPVIEKSDGAIWFDGSDLYLADGMVRRSSYRSSTDVRVRTWVSGACLWITGSAWETVGGFDDAYFLYWEDIDLSWRAQNAGITVAVVAEARAVHDAGGTQHEAGSRAKSNIYYYYNVRNRLLFAGQHLDDDDYRSWLRATRRVSWAILLRGGRRQLLTSIGPVRAVLRGIRDGRRLARATRRSRAGSQR